MGHYSKRHPASRENYLEQLNQAFSEEGPSYVTFHDVQSLVTLAGAQAWFDPRFYLEAKMPCGPECLVSYAYSVTRLILAMIVGVKRCLFSTWTTRCGEA